LSFESGRKLGLTASLIAVATPVITVILYVFLFLSFFGIGTPTASGGTYGGSLYPAGIFFAFIAIGIIGFLGIILFLIAMHRLSKYYNEPSIFKNALYGFLVNIVGIAVLIGILLVLLFATIFSFAARSTVIFSPFGFIFGFLGVFAAIFVVAIVSAVFYMRAFHKLGEKSGISNFNTAGTLYLVGTALTIVLVGGLVAWIAWIFALMGFNSLKPKTAEPPIVSYPTTQPIQPIRQGEKKFCIHCAAEISIDSVYCPNCGKVQQ
jgi:uncharacterized membrane protein